MNNKSKQNHMRPSSFCDCFRLDSHELNPIPKSLPIKIYRIIFSSRYSMPVLMRLSQYFYNLGNPKIFNVISVILRRLNQSINNFEHGADPKIEAGVVFHHSGVCITSETTIERSVHIFRNVVFGSKEGLAPYVKSHAKICSNSVILGGVTIGRRSIVAPGAVVVKDVPDNKIAAGVPANIIGDVTDANYNF